MLVTCKKHNIEYENSIPGTWLKAMCPKCVEEMNAHEADMERREAQEESLSKLRAMNIEPEYYGATLENFIALTPELKKAVEKVRQLVSGEIREIVMIGGNGTGKTHLAVAAVKELGGKIYSMYEISTRIRSTYTPRAREDELDVVNELARTPLLVIDEIGRTKGSGAELDWLSYILDKRHVRNLPTILISNKHLKKDCPERGCPNCFDNYIGADVMSRLSEEGLVLHFAGDDYRKRVKEHVREGARG